MSLKIKQIIKKIVYISSFSLVFIFVLNFFNLINFNKEIPKTNAEKEYKLITVRPISQV
jgi:hypothetical protein